MSSLTEKEFRDMYTKSPDGHWVVNDLHKSPMTVETWSRSVATLIKEYIGAGIAKLEQRLAQIERREVDLVDPLEAMAARIEALEARLDRAEQKGLGVRYLGVWQKAQKYDRGDLATYNGSVWHCNATTRSMPGVDSDWQLAVKAGRDAR